MFVVGNFIFLKFISNNVEPNYYGTFVLGLTVVTGFNQILGGPFINSFHRHIPILDKHNKIFYLNSVVSEYIIK